MSKLDPVQEKNCKRDDIRQLISTVGVIGNSRDCGKLEGIGIQRGQQLMSSGQMLPHSNGSPLLPDLLNLSREAGNPNL